MSRLPPFIALRALEAASRHRSYSRAAEELSVTHGAVSHQIRRLETELGVRLFRRHGNAMEPTPAALRLASRVAEAVALLAGGLAAESAARESGPLVVSAEPGIARRWLVPRLTRLYDQIGEGAVELRLEDKQANMISDGVDAGIRHGRGSWPGFEAAALFGDRLFPVCSPALLERHKLQRLEDLRRAPLLRHAYWSWPMWFRSLGLPPPPDRGMLFDDSSFLVEAAIQGLGVALARSTLVESDLQAGRLVRPFPEEVESDWGYYFVWRGDAPRLDRVLALRDWLVAEASASEAQLARRPPELSGSS